MQPFIVCFCASNFWPSHHSLSDRGRLSRRVEGIKNIANRNDFLPSYSL
jgi:hypothetical protein